MIGLDTNVLVRYLTQDDQIQSPRATEIVEQLLTVEAPGYISAVVVAELVWVLIRRYRWDRPTVSDVVEQLLTAEQLRLEHSAAVYHAMIVLADTNIDFADALLSEIARRAGCSRTLTFDRRAQRLPGVEPA